MLLDEKYLNVVESWNSRIQKKGVVALLLALLKSSGSDPFIIPTSCFASVILIIHGTMLVWVVSLCANIRFHIRFHISNCKNTDAKDVLVSVILIRKQLEEVKQETVVEPSVEPFQF